SGPGLDPPGGWTPAGPPVLKDRVGWTGAGPRRDQLDPQADRAGPSGRTAGWGPELGPRLDQAGLGQLDPSLDRLDRALRPRLEPTYVAGC
ncbi:unnamed protein product, partial [Gadus morhua 'NCC']